MMVLSPIMELALDAAALRQRVLADNIANAETPYFRRSDVRFADVLTEAVRRHTFVGKRTDPRHLPIGEVSHPRIQVVQEGRLTNSNAQSNVDLDYEMAAMAQNALWYQALVQQTSKALEKYARVLEGR
ncbi:MAG: flagellar basal-body rod protein FlgB [Bacillaceae bacterium G1]|nr:MAG: flagellar basal-body rod protein FlgB [Bacillaceae bacterium G1]